MLVDSANISVEVVIVGGGVAGLWLLGRLRAQGRRVLLVETEALGAGQTRFAQGIIHGGTKYTLSGALGKSAQAVAAMPARWRACMEGQGEINLAAVRVLSPHQYLWSTAKVGSRLAGFFASHAMRSRVQPVEGDARPSAMRDPAFRGRIYRLDEPVLDTASLIAALAAPHHAVIFKSEADRLRLRAGGEPEVVLGVADETLHITTKHIVLAAGAGNAQLLAALGETGPAMQRRALHMVLVRGDLPGELFAHCLGASTNPRLTVTSHRDADGGVVWYLGGELAEHGVSRSRDEQIAAAQTELRELLPWLRFDACQWATLRVDRAEPAQPGGGRPDGAFVQTRDSVITAWPTKMALAPVLADAVLARLGTRTPSTDSERTLPLWPKPEYAPLPWQRDAVWS